MAKTNGAQQPFFDQDWSYVPPTAEQLKHGLKKLETFYDARGFAIQTIFPDGSQQRVAPGRPPDPANADVYTPTPWEQFTYDPNDNAGRTDLTGSQAWQTHWDTPASELYDPLGRVIESVTRTEANRELVTKTRYDIEGNALEINDPLGRTIATSRYDSINRAWRTELLDAGTTRVVLDPLGAQLEQRDARGAVALAEHDMPHRLRTHWASDRPGATPTARELTVYGDQAGLTNPAGENLLGRAYQAYDEAGRITTSSYDFAGNLLEKEWRVSAPSVILSGTPTGSGPGWADTSYTVDWKPPPGKTLEGYAETLLDPFKFQTSTSYDALRRPTMMQTPVTVNGARGTFDYSYEPGGGLTHIDLDSATYVERTVWNARAQRDLCVLGNGIMTRSAYDPRTFRLARLRSEPCQPTSPAGWRSSGPPLQDHGYPLYDQVGNLWQLLDTPPASGVPPANELLRAFTYDPLYRLLTATGRETDIPPDAPPWAESPTSVDIAKVRAYAETYAYDDFGNLHMLTRKSGGIAGTYTRNLPVTPGSNRLEALVAGTRNPTTYSYTYDNAGNMLTETTSRHFEWDHADRLATFRTQPTPTTEPSVYPQHRYDASGQRVVKLARHQGGQIEATAYIDGLFERLVIGTGPKATQHDTIHVVDRQSRVALIRIGPPVPGDPSPPTLYQLGDHLGSSEIVLDKAGRFVKREEFRPYGETSHGGYARKRYRFTGRERDEESSLYYHGARYYAPWLCRWTTR